MRRRYFRVKAFHELHAGNLRSDELQEEIDTKGYVLIRELLPRHVVQSVLTDVTGILSAQSWLPPDPAHWRAFLGRERPSVILTPYLKASISKSSTSNRFTRC